MKTKRVLMLVLTLSASTSISFAAIAQQPPPPPPPADDYFPKRWKEFSPEEGGFKVLLPGTPKASVTTEQSPQGPLVVHSFHFPGVVNQRVVYVDYAVNVEEPSRVKQFLDDVRDGGLAKIAQGNPRIIKETELSIDGHPGRFLQVEVGGDTILRMKSIAVGNRLYMVIASSGKANTNVMGSQNDYEEIAMAFLDSFQLAKR